MKKDAEKRRKYDQERKSNYESWQGRVQAWKESGLSQREYCQRSSLKYGTFKNWIGKLRKQGNFLPVCIVSEKKKEGFGYEIEIRTPRDFSIILKNDFEEEVLKKILKTMESWHV